MSCFSGNINSPCQQKWCVAINYLFHVGFIFFFFFEVFGCTVLKQYMSQYLSLAVSRFCFP